MYRKKLEEKYTGEIPIYSPLYAATEGLLGVNIDGPAHEPQSYVLLPRAMFYEFIDVQDSSLDQPSTVGFDGLEQGKCYEVVVSTKCGLYRYRMGDVVQVDRFENQAPVVQVLYRQGQLLDVRGEKMPEHTVFQSLKAATTGLGLNLADYSCTCSALDVADSVPGASPRYIVYAELSEDAGQSAVTELSKQFDLALRQSHPVYKSFRSKRSIAEAEVRAVQPGGFRKLRTRLIERGMSPSQLKMPRVLKEPELIRHLEEMVVR